MNSGFKKSEPSMKIFSLIALVFVLSCGRAPEIKRRQPLFTSTDNLVVLSDKANREVLLTKYQNKISLICNFRIDNRPGYDISSFNFSGFTVNLAAGEGPMDLGAKMDNGQSFTVAMRVTEFDILPEVKIPGYEMKNSPVVKLLIRGREIHGSRVENVEREIILYERVGVEMKDLFPGSYPQDLICKLHTEPKEEYRDEWVKTGGEALPAEAGTDQ